MPTGCGKTVCVSSFIVEMLWGGYTGNRILVATETIRDLTSIYKAVEKQVGPLMKQVGIFHSMKEKECKKEGYVECSTGNPQDYPIILVSHAGAYSRQQMENYGILGGGRRDLIIWDEALVKSEGRWLTSNDIYKAVGQVKYNMRSLDAKEKPYAEWLVNIADHINNKEAYMQKTDRSFHDMTIKFDGVVEDALKVFSKVLPDDRSRSIGEHLLGNAGKNLRLFLDQSKVAILGYDLKLPELMRKVVVLDASSTVRALYANDKTMTTKTKFNNPVSGGTEYFDQLKLFNKVNLTQIKGYKATKTVLNGRKMTPEYRELIKSVADLVLSLPEDEKILLCTTKEQNTKIGFINHLQDEFAERDLDMPKNLTYIWWGRHKARNDLADHKHTVAVGIQRRDALDMTANEYGQSGAIGEGTHNLNYLMKTEQIAQFQQLVGRGTSRAMTGNQANEANIYLYEHAVFDDVWNGQDSIDLIQLALPGINYNKVSAILCPQMRQKVDTLVEHINNSTETEITSQSLKKLVGGPQENSRWDWEKILKAVLMETGWKQEGRRILK